MNPRKKKSRPSRAHDQCWISRTTTPHRLRTGIRFAHFYEAILITEGKGSQRINNQHVPIKKGDLLLIRPQDDHQILPKHSSQLSVIAVFIHDRFIDRLARRYFSNTSFIFSKHMLMPAQISLAVAVQRRVEAHIAELDENKQSIFAVELFIMNLINDTASSVPVTAFPNIPDWMQEALAAVLDPAVFVLGPAGFVEACHRCPAYVSRSVSKYMGRTVTDVVNDARILYACQRLTTTRDEIVRIASDCGFSSLSHFYKVFSDHTGTPPGRYRVTHR